MKKIILPITLCIFLSCSGSQQSVKQDQQEGVVSQSATIECLPWEEIIKKQEYQGLSEDLKQKAREQYFADCLAKNIKDEDREKEYNRFLISALEAEKADDFGDSLDCVYGDCKDGMGIYIWPSRAKYIGQWKEYLRSGEGKFIYSNGDKYSGQYKDDKRDGEGTYTWQDGTKYEGQWKDGNMHGEGTYVWSSGAKYVGQWKEDKRDGGGTYDWQDGAKYTGPWQGNKMHGEGTLYGPDGKIIHKGNFKNGEYVVDK